MSEPFYKLNGGMNGLEINSASETYDGEKVKLFYSYPNGTNQTFDKMSFWERVKTIFKKSKNTWLKRIFYKRNQSRYENEKQHMA